MQITKIVCKRSRKVKQINAMEEIGKVCQGIKPRWLLGKFFQTFKKSTILLLYKIFQTI